MTPDEAIVLGAQHTRDHLRIIEAAYGVQVAMAYAGSMAVGVRNVVASKRGRKCAWDLMDGLADDLLVLPPNAGEGKI